MFNRWVVNRKINTGNKKKTNFSFCQPMTDRKHSAFCPLNPVSAALAPFRRRRFRTSSAFYSRDAFIDRGNYYYRNWFVLRLVATMIKCKIRTLYKVILVLIIVSCVFKLYLYIYNALELFDHVLRR